MSSTTTSPVPPIGTTARHRPLDGAWTLTYRTTQGPVPTTLPADGADGYRRIPGTVPGSVEIDLMAAGLLPDIYVGDHVERAWELEYGDWWYRTEFTVTAEDSVADLALVFLGVDTVADVIVNGTVLAHLDNMFIEHEVPIGSVARVGANELVVHVHSPLLAAERYPLTAHVWQANGSMESLAMRKAAHMYGWDIAPRIVSAGLHRGVELVERAPDRISQFHLRTVSIDRERGEAVLDFFAETTGGTRQRDVVVELEAVEPGSGSRFGFRATPEPRSLLRRIPVDDPELWFPRGYGRQTLYDVTLRLVIDGVTVDEHRFRHGIRTIDLDIVPETGPAGRFEFFVNGDPITALGTNWVQLDALHARDAERLPRALDLLDRSGCNMVRCWGGNLYESDAFYERCDELGILVWQDFSLACARYPQDPDFQARIATEAEAVVLRLRRHACLALWNGSNENDDVYVDGRIDPNSDVLTRTVLPAVVAANDPGRPYIPGSPFYAGDLYLLGRTAPPEQHLWGERAWFKDPYYSESDARFVSEIGFHGAPAESSIERFLPDAGGVISVDDPTWTLHETRHNPGRPTHISNRTLLMLEQAELVFGAIGTDLAAVVPASQIAQAEAKKFFVELTRLSPERTGVIWWNLLDCWPQTSDAVVDYYFEEKVAFHHLRRSQQPVCLIAAEANGWTHEVMLVSEGPAEGRVEFTVTRIDDGETVLAGDVDLSPSQVRVPLGRIPRARGAQVCYLLEWRVGETRGTNHYISGFPPYDLATFRDVYLPAIEASESR